MWLEKSDERVAVAEAFLATLHARLLHPGVDTHAILVYYVNIVYALRLVDTSGVILSKVLPPVQRYLRTRPDIIPAVVNALLGDDDAFALLRMELASASASLSRSARLQEDDAAQARPEYWMDPTWTPRPVDAGPEYSQMRTRDVIDLLVSIFDDHNGFIHALEEHTAQQLVRTQDYDTTRVVRRHTDAATQQRHLQAALWREQFAPLRRDARRHCRVADERRIVPRGARCGAACDARACRARARHLAPVLAGD